MLKSTEYYETWECDQCGRSERLTAKDTSFRPLLPEGWHIISIRASNHEDVQVKIGDSKEDFGLRAVLCTLACVAEWIVCQGPKVQGMLDG